MCDTQFVEELAHVLKRGAASLKLGRRLGYRHQSAQAQARCGSDRLHQRWNRLRRAAGLARLVVDIDLDQHIQRCHAGGTIAIQRFDQFFAVETLQPVEVRGNLTAFVRLQRADQMPFQGGIGLIQQGLIQ